MSAPSSAVLGTLAGRRYLVRWRGIEVPSYTAMLYIGCVAGVLAGAAVAGAAGLDGTRFTVATTVLLIPAFAGARLWFVLGHWSTYRSEPGRILRRSEGGSALYGGLLLSLVVSVPLLALMAIPFWVFWDAASFTMLVGLIFTRVGCVMNGCCAGRPAPGWLGVQLPDDHGAWDKRIPTQLLEAGWAALVLVGAALLRGGKPPGAVFLAVLAAYGAGRLLLEPTRARGGSRANIASSALLFVGGSIALIAGSAD